jgi:hypothetical protein
MVEYGTSRMAAQPYMAPMAQRMGGEFADMAAQAAREVLV